MRHLKRRDDDRRQMCSIDGNGGLRRRDSDETCADAQRTACAQVRGACAMERSGHDHDVPARVFVATATELWQPLTPQFGCVGERVDGD
jgi:hypothetical protein